ncbi:MAG: phosphopantothenoylcysteine decarboxylase [Gemmataceae bacterium]|nr:phosphopantothenoylcysteine decarboxylase [Gemmataceae bacterium]
MANLLLGVTGSVAAIRTPELYEQLRQAGHAVKVVATQASLYFFDPVALDPARSERNPAVVLLDADEWPGRAEGRRWQRDDPVPHIELRRWADLLLIAPLDANTLAKLANGLSDNCLTCVWRAWDLARPVVLAPAMNTLMWEHPLTIRHWHQLAAMIPKGIPAPDLDVDAVITWINRQATKLRVVPPISKRLACGDIGVGAMASLDEIVAAVRCALDQ